MEVDGFDIFFPDFLFWVILLVPIRREHFFQGVPVVQAQAATEPIEQSRPVKPRQAAVPGT